MASTDRLTFSTLGGDRIDLSDEALSVVTAREEITQLLQLRYPQQIVLLLPNGGHLEDSDTLPTGGIIQVQKNPPPQDTWSRIRWDAENFDEEVLIKALDEAFPYEHDKPGLLSMV